MGYRVTVGGGPAQALPAIIRGLLAASGADDHVRGPGVHADRTAARVGTATAWQPKRELATYADSYHGFDGTRAMRRLNNIPGGLDRHGGRVGGHPDARADALARSDQFLRKYLD